MRLTFAVAILLAVAFFPGLSRAQPSPLGFKQKSDTAQVTALKASEFAALGDPLFNLVLKDKANLTKLVDVQSAIQPDDTKRSLFVVEERIVSSAKTSGRRSVIAFTGTNGGEALKGNVMLSVSFGPNGIPDTPDVEAWGWDNHRQRYNYYKLDTAGSVNGKPVWKFRASSERAELLSASERQGTCLACHVSGAPIMKELFFPWNNWSAGVGGSFKADYLDPNSTATDLWPAAKTPAFKRFAPANLLEDDFLKPALKRFSLSRLNTALKRDDGTGNRAVNSAGAMTVVEGRRLLRPLFETTDINLYSSQKTSGLHPFGGPADFVAAQQMNMPVDQFFLNTDLIAGGAEGGLGGLNLVAARNFASLATLTQQENKDLITKFQVKLNNVSGDTQFAWFVPGASFSDNALIDQCLQQGIITPHFLAAALAVDVENPVFSAKRAALLAFVPDQFDFKPVAANANPLAVPRNAADDPLTAAVIAKIDAANPAAGSPADEFRTLLKSADAVQELNKRVTAYVARVKKSLDTAPANAAVRKAELERLFGVVIGRRKAMLAHPTLKNLDETGGKLLLPSAP
jgi:hypothetical protein